MCNLPCDYRSQLHDINVSCQVYKTSSPVTAQKPTSLCCNMTVSATLSMGQPGLIAPVEYVPLILYIEYGNRFIFEKLCLFFLF
jgi:hypothetical protein